MLVQVNLQLSRSSQERKLIISDTPGGNAQDCKLEHNVWMAAAFNYKLVSRLFIVVKAEHRKDSIIDSISKYANRFLEPAEMDVLGVLVTHMDTVKWTEEELTPDVERKLGIDTVVFSNKNTQAETLLSYIRKTCTKKLNLTVDDENFFKFFKLHNNHMKILRCTNDEVKRFSAMKNISEKNNFNFYRDGAASEAGHVANMVNQLRMVLYDIRADCVRFQLSEQGVSEYRKCPHCGLVWTEVEGGCDSRTTCGNRPSNVNDSLSVSVLATFSFQWIGDKLNIAKAGKKNVKSQRSSSSKFVGCGKTIIWSEMATIAVPLEFSETVKICTSDVKMLPPAASRFQENLSNLLHSAMER